MGLLDILAGGATGINQMAQTGYNLEQAKRKEAMEQQKLALDAEQQRQQMASLDQQRRTGLLSALGGNVYQGVMDPKLAEGIYRQADPTYRGATPLFAQTPFKQTADQKHEETIQKLQQAMTLAKDKAELQVMLKQMGINAATANMLTRLANRRDPQPRQDHTSTVTLSDGVYLLNHTTGQKTKIGDAPPKGSGLILPLDDPAPVAVPAAAPAPTPKPSPLAPYLPKTPPPKPKPVVAAKPKPKSKPAGSSRVQAARDEFGF